MQRKDGQRRALDFNLPHASCLGGSAAQWPQPEPISADSLPGERVEDIFPSWESAWIDLGGEG